MRKVLGYSWLAALAGFAAWAIWSWWIWAPEPLRTNDTGIAATQAQPIENQSARANPDPAPEKAARSLSAQSNAEAEPAFIFSSLDLARLAGRQLAAPARVPGDLVTRIPAVEPPDEQAALAKLLRDPSDHPSVRNEIAHLLRRSRYPPLTAILVEQLRHPEEQELFRGFIVQHLWLNHAAAGEPERAAIRAALVACLADRHASVRREALLALTRLRDPQAAAAAVEWLHASGPAADACRDLVIRCVQELGFKDLAPSLRPFARARDEATRVAAIVALSGWGDAASRGAFEEAARAESAYVRQAGRAALARLEKGP